MNYAKQSTAKTFIVGPIRDSTGAAKTDEVVASIKVTKNGAVGAPHGSSTLTHSHTGHYLYAANAGDLDTLGMASFSLNSGTNAMDVVRLQVVPANVYDSLVAGSASLLTDLVDAPNADALDAAAAALLDHTLVGHNSPNTVGRALKRAEDYIAHDGTARGATADTIQLDAGASAEDGYYVPGMIVITGGPGDGQFRRMESYDGLTQTATVATPWITQPTAASEFQIEAWASVRVSENDDKTGYALTGAYDAAKTAGDATLSNQTAILAAIGSVGGVPGPGATAVVVTLQDTVGAPIADADVWITTDAAGANIVAGTLQTNSLGQATFMLDSGVTYYRWAQKDGMNFTNPQSFIA